MNVHAGSGATDTLASPIDWDLATRVAVRASGRTNFSGTPAAVTMPDELESLTHVAQELVEDFTGLHSLAGAPRAEVIDRSRWIRANVAGFRHILEPIAERLTGLPEGDGVGDRRASPRVGRVIGSKLLAVELGMLLGFLSQRVLGQYDLLLPEEAAGSGVDAGVDGVVYYVGPNVAHLERQHGFRPRDFRLWIALHEVTHRTQFTAVSWLRPHFLRLVDDGLSTFELDPQQFARILSVLVDRLRRGENPVGEDGLVGLLATPEQRRALDAMQGLMTLLEGHGNYVMDVLGREHVAGQEDMSRILRQRRRQGGVARVVLRLMGMEMKVRQYEEGQKWVTGVIDRAGMRGLDRAWEAEENLPTLTELRGDPAEWLARVCAEPSG